MTVKLQAADPAEAAKLDIKMSEHRFEVWLLAHQHYGFEMSDYVPVLYRSRKDAAVAAVNWVGSFPVKAELVVEMPK